MHNGLISTRVCICSGNRECQFPSAHQFFNNGHATVSDSGFVWQAFWTIRTSMPWPKVKKRPHNHSFRLLVWGSLKFIMLITKIYSVWTSAQIEVTCKGLQENLRLTGITGCNSTQYNQTGNEVEFHSFRHPVWRQPDCSTLKTRIYYILANAARVVLYNYWLEF